MSQFYCIIPIFITPNFLLEKTFIFIIFQNDTIPLESWVVIKFEILKPPQNVNI